MNELKKLSLLELGERLTAAQTISKRCHPHLRFAGKALLEELKRRDRQSQMTHDEICESALEEQENKGYNKALEDVSSHFGIPQDMEHESAYRDGYDDGYRAGSKHRLKDYPTEAEAWMAVAVEANRDLDAYLREVMPELPEHYGMPVNGVRKVVQKLQDDIIGSSLRKQ